MLNISKLLPDYRVFIERNNANITMFIIYAHRRHQLVCVKQSTFVCSDLITAWVPEIEMNYKLKMLHSVSSITTASIQHTCHAD